MLSVSVLSSRRRSYTLHFRQWFSFLSLSDLQRHVWSSQLPSQSAASHQRRSARQGLFCAHAHRYCKSGNINVKKYLANVVIRRGSLMINPVKLSVRIVASWKILGVVISLSIEPYNDFVRADFFCEGGAPTIFFKWTPSKNANISSRFSSRSFWEVVKYFTR